MATPDKSIASVDSTMSLPPLVQGLLRGYVRLTLLRVELSQPSAEPLTVQPVWWGEPEGSKGTQIMYSGKPQSVRFPVVCSHKYLAR